jgi:hypothetical protein
MSITRSLPYGPLNVIRPVPAARVAPRNDTPREGDRVKRQGAPRTASAASSCYPVCGSYETSSGRTVYECDFPYWHMLLWGTEPVYRLIASHPTVALARSIVLEPVIASTWDVTWTDLPDEHPAIKWTEDVILPMRREVMREAVRAFDFGYQPFAVVWEIVEGRYVPHTKPLLPESTTILEDKYGNFAGVKNVGEGTYSDKNEITLNNLESWVPALDGEAGYKYGRSRYENIRSTAWANWLETLVRVNQLQNKLSGIIPIVRHSPDGYIDDDGEAVNFSTGGDTLLAALPRAEGVRIERAMSVSELLKEHGDHPHIDKLIAASDIDVTFYDAGNVSQALPGFIAKLEYLDKLLFRGTLRPERAGLEAVAAGSRADSEQHTASGAPDSESIDANLTASYNAGPYYTAIRLNFGEDVARRIRLLSGPLQERKQAASWKFLDRAMSSDPEVATAMAMTADVDAMFTQSNIPSVGKFAASLEKVRSEAREREKAKQAAKPAVPPGD